METYIEYEFLDKHIQYSKELYILDKRGRHILDQLERKKLMRRKRSGDLLFCSDVKFTYDTLTDITNTKQFSLRLYFCLQHYLDELVFSQVKNITKFIIEDDEYKLTDLYFNQSAWNENEEIQTYDFYENNKHLNSEEAMYINLYLFDFEEYINKLFNFISALKNSGYIGVKLKEILNRFTFKIETVKTRMLKIIKQEIEKN